MIHFRVQVYDVIGTRDFLGLKTLVSLFADLLMYKLFLI